MYVGASEISNLNLSSISLKASVSNIAGSVLFIFLISSNNETKKTFRQRYVKSTYGTYESKVRTYLKFFQASMIYGLYRRDKLQKSLTINKIFLAFDLTIILNVLKYGDFHVIDENLLHRYNKGSHSIIGTLREYDISLINIIFLEFPFTFWCLKNLGFKNFIRNFDVFLKINIRGGLIILFETIRISKRIVFRQDMFW